MGMNKIKCPHCGYEQETRPHVILCDHCYANIKDVVDAHFKKESEEPTEVSGPSGSPLRRGIFAPNELGTAFLGGILAIGKGIWAKQGCRRSNTGGILIRTFKTFAKRFWALYPLMYLSICFFMLIGTFVSIAGLQTLFHEEYPTNPSITIAIAFGIAACLFVVLYTQAAYIFAVSYEELSLGDALTRAWHRFGSYVALIVLMVGCIGAGLGMFLIPGVIAGILFSLAPFVFARENAGLISALSKSTRYVAGSWLKVVLRLAPVAIVMLFAWYFYTYLGVPLLMQVSNPFIFIFIISGFMSIPVMLITILVSIIYEDLRTAAIPVPSPEAISKPPEKKVVAETIPTSEGLLPVTDLIGRSWGLYKKRFVTLTILNLISYLPHAIYIGFLIAAYFALKEFSATLSSTGLTGLFNLPFGLGLSFLLLLPKWMLALLIVAPIVLLILHVIFQIFGLVLYLSLELAYVYALADEKISVWGAIKKSRARLKEFFWVELYRKFIVSTGALLLVPGAVFWVWYEFTPFVFALQREEGTALSSLWESKELVRGLLGKVFKQLVFLKFLPVVIVVILVWFAFAGIPFYWIFGTLLFAFTGHHPPGMFIIYSSHFWVMLYLCSFILVGGFYVPFQKMVMYLFYLELKDVKAAR